MFFGLVLRIEVHRIDYYMKRKSASIGLAKYSFFSFDIICKYLFQWHSSQNRDSKQNKQTNKN